MDEKKAIPGKRVPKRSGGRRKPPAAAKPRPSYWDPERDESLAAAFSAARPKGKSRCKAALQAELALKPRPRTPVFVYAGELEPSAGFDLVLGALPALFKIAAQVVILAPRGGVLAARAAEVAREHGERLALLVEDDERLLRRVLAGGDVLLLPASSSAGLAWRGLRYGVLPVVMAGSPAASFLKAAVTPATGKTGTRRARGAGADAKPRGAAPDDVPGFTYRSASAAALGRAALKAAEAYGEAVLWRRLRRAALRVAELPGDVDLAGAASAAEAPAGARPVPRVGSPVLTLAQAAHQFDAAPVQTVAVLAPEPPAEPYIDWGPPMPARYGEDALELLVQSPRRLYGYWEVSPKLYAQAGSAPRLQLVLHDEGAQRALSAEIGDFGEWWIESEPGHSYQLELRAPGGGMLLRSGRVKTPRENGSPHSEVQWSTRPAAGRTPTSAAPGAAAAAARRRTGRGVAVLAGAAVGAKTEVVGAPGLAKPPAGAARRETPAEELTERRAPASEERPRRGAGDYPVPPTAAPRSRK